MTTPAMTPGEKVAAEWEARHDVAARGAHASPAGVQDYLRHRHAKEVLGQGSGHPRPHPPAPAHEPASAKGAAPSRAPGWWQRVLRRRPS